MILNYDIYQYNYNLLNSKYNKIELNSLNKNNNNTIYYNNTIQLNDSYNPYTLLENSVSIFDIEYNKLNIYNYFKMFSKFIYSTNNCTNSLDKIYKTKLLNINTFIECLCKMYVGHTLHYKISEEISNKTNIKILKGDYLFSSGYNILSKLGNPALIKYYSKISMILSKVSLFIVK